MKKYYVTAFFLLLFQLVLKAQVVLNQTNSDNTNIGAQSCVDDNGVTAGYTLFRAFDLETLNFSEFDITDVEFGINNVSNVSSNFEVIVSIYGATEFPSLNLTQLASTPVPLLNSDSDTVKSVSISTIINVSTYPILVVGISVPDEVNNGGTTHCTLGSNFDGGTMPYYFFSSECDFHSIPIVPNNNDNFVLKITGLATLSINEFSLEKNISIYPNPTNDIININLSKDIIINSVELYDITGKQIIVETNNLKSIDLSKLKIGVYIIRIQTEFGIVSKKIIKK